jgi:hypothetical protein
VTAGSTATTIRTKSRPVFATRKGSISARFHSAALDVVDQLALELLAADPRAAVAPAQFRDRVGREVGGVVERRAARHDHRAVVARHKLAQQRDRTRRRGHHHLRASDAQRRHQRFVPGLGVAPHGELVTPRARQVGATDPLRALGAVGIDDAAVCEADLPVGLVVRAAVEGQPERAKQSAPTLQASLTAVLRRASDHRVINRRRERLVCEPLRPGARLAPPSPGHYQPHEPVTIRRELLRARFLAPRAIGFIRGENVSRGQELGGWS